jgi:putative component of toxin-antitoxin plasmid stabilization module
MIEILQTEHYRKWFVILLAGEDKTTQAVDIEKAKKLVQEIEV